MIEADRLWWGFSGNMKRVLQQDTLNGMTGECKIDESSAMLGFSDVLTEGQTQA